MKVDHRLCSLGECGRHIFRGKEDWISRNNPGEVFIVIFQGDKNQLLSIPASFLKETEERIQTLMGAGNVCTKKEADTRDLHYKVSEYMPLATGE